MKILCLICDDNDASWLPEFIERGRAGDEVVFFAPGLLGRAVAERLGLPHEDFSHLTDQQDKYALYDHARRMAYDWHRLPELRNIPQVEELREYGGCPVLDMVYSHLLLALCEILQAHDFLRTVVDEVHPDRIVFGGRPDPFAQNRLFMMFGENGLEREAAQLIGHDLGVDVEVMPYSEEKETSGSPAPKPSPLMRIVHRGVRMLRFLMGSPRKSVPGKWPKGTGRRVLLFSWGDQYFPQIRNLVLQLCASGVRPAVVFIGGRVSRENMDGLRSRGVAAFFRDAFQDGHEADVRKQWEAKGRAACNALEGNAALDRLFSLPGHGSVAKLALKAIGKELGEVVPFIVENIDLAGRIYDLMDPDLVCSHFDIHPKGTSLLLPARLRGLRTLALSHSVPTGPTAIKDTFSAERYVVAGQDYRDALIQSMGGGDEIIITGEPGLDTMRPEADRALARKRLGLNPNTPVCVYCDNTSWTHRFSMARHGLATAVDCMAELARSMPPLHVIFRMHHGVDLRKVRRYVEGLEIENLEFQVTPNPPLPELLQAVDVLVTMPSTAIAEALLHGVPVLYLAPHAVVDCYEGFEAIDVVTSYQELAPAVEAVLTRAPSREAVRELAQPFFDKALNGADGKAAQRVADVIFSMAEESREGKKPGFDDWQERLRASAHMTSADWKTHGMYRPGSRQKEE